MTELSDYQRLVEKPMREAWDKERAILIGTLEADREGAKKLAAERDKWFDEAQRLGAMLRTKDEAMGVLFERLAKAGVDCSDLIS
jgi:hypothetical protein